MKTIKQEYIIDAPVEKVWRAFIDHEEINEWGGGPAKMDDKVGSAFSLWGGDIHGTNVRVEENRVLEQDWYGGEWSEPSRVKFILSEVNGKTKVELIQQNVPDKEIDNIDDGWRRYYLGPMKEYLEKK